MLAYLADSLYYVPTLKKWGQVMPKATSCLLNSETIDVGKALDLRDEAKRLRQPRPDFRCVDCEKAVRPHRDGGDGAAILSTWNETKHVL